VRFQRRQLSKVVSILADTGAPVPVTLPDGPGYYVLRRVMVRQTAPGVSTATTIQPEVYGESAAVPETRVWGASAAVAIGSPSTWPADADSPAEPGRVAYAPAGEFMLRINAAGGAGPTGGTYSVALLVELVR